MIPEVPFCSVCLSPTDEACFSVFLLPLLSSCHLGRMGLVTSQTSLTLSSLTWQEGHQEGGEEHNRHLLQQKLHRSQRRKSRDPCLCHIPRGEAAQPGASLRPTPWACCGRVGIAEQGIVGAETKSHRPRQPQASHALCVPCVAPTSQQAGACLVQL